LDNVTYDNCHDCYLFVRALYIQSDLRKDTENWFSALQKALYVSESNYICQVNTVNTGRYNVFTFVRVFVYVQMANP